MFLNTAVCLIFKEIQKKEYFKANPAQAQLLKEISRCWAQPKYQIYNTMIKSGVYTQVKKELKYEMEANKVSFA
jgi:hypothetical protein